MFWSCSRRELWHKGATSGNFIDVEEILVDCDGDTLVLLARPDHAACHTGARPCFFDGWNRTWRRHNERCSSGPRTGLIRQRQADMPEGSYTTSLFKDGLPRIAQKVGEEGVEVVIAGLTQDDIQLTYEMADLLYHCLVLLVDRGLSWSEVEAELANRAR